jgi:hypothetical protein
MKPTVLAPPEDVNMQSVIVAIDAETLERLRAAARSEHATLAEVIRTAVRIHLSAASRKQV